MMLDLRASLIAGVLASLVSLGVGMAVLQHLHENGIVLARLIATIALGREALDPEVVSESQAFVVGLAIHLVLGLLFALLISVALHRWGFWVGLFGGALFGLALYAINTYTMSRFFPEFYFFRSWFMVGFHVLFGALCGGIYEALERDRDRMFRRRG
ncbi:MAG: hypothetical protein NZ533_00580 [Casimicrobiaceae bacterium]|nr:hypothetical protein [Casimicrobiaceae bacterium]MDW8311957.1 hypothetical protein [Burkholderiales bacterium]